MARSTATASIVIDCTERNMPDGIRVEACRRFPGWGLYASRRVASGDVAYRFGYERIPLEAEVSLVSELGRRTMALEHFWDVLCPERGWLRLTPDMLSPRDRARLTQWYGLRASDASELHRILTEDHRCERLITGFDHLINHSQLPNCEYRDRYAALRFERGQPIFEESLYARRDLVPGDELTVDYRSSCAREEVPDHWAE